MKKQLLCLFALLTLAGGAFAQTIPSYVPTNGLVGWWPFNGNANDESGNGNNGTVNGATPTTDRIGNANSAYNFNGTSDYIFVNPINALGTSNAQVISFAYWINQKGVGSDIFDLRSTNNSNFGHWLDYQGTGGNLSNFSVVNYNAPASEGQVWTSTEQIQQNNWYFVVTELDFSSGNLKMYFNGQLKSYTIINPTPVGGLDNPKLNIGSRFDFFDNRCCFFNGYLDDFAIYNRALTQQEITALYQGNNTVSSCPTLPANLQQGLVGYWPFCGNANDESGNGNNGTVNGATLTTDRFGNTGSAYSFNGSSNWIQIEDHPSLQLKLGTVSVWIKYQSNPNKMQLLVRQDINDPYLFPSNYGFEINPGPVGVGDGLGPRVQGMYNDNCNPNQVNWTSFSSQTNVGDNQWNHIVGLYDTAVVKIYIDGVLVDSLAATSAIMGGCPGAELLIGRGWVQYPLWYNGQIDDLAIFNRPLTQDEITQLYEIQNCSTPLLLSLQNPATVTGTPGGSVQLQAQANLDSTRFRWESDAAGLGWMAIQNNARYSGADSARLQVSNIDLANHLQRFRVLGQSGGCRDTSDVVVLQVSDTCINTITVYDTSLVSVTDTLRIDVPVFTAGNPEQINTLKVYPVPATNKLYINTGNYASMPGYSIKITRINGQDVIFEAQANEPLLDITLSDFGANGVYFLNLYNASGALVTSRKIVLY